MASAWGAWLHADDWRCGVDAQVVSQTDTTCTVRVKCIFDNVYLIGSNASNGNSVSCACDGQSRSENVSLGKNYGHGRGAVVKTADFTVQKGLGSGRNVWCSTSIRVAIGSPGTGSAGVNVWIPSRSYSVPKPPKNPSAARVSDASQKISWEPDYTGMDGAYPWAKVYVDRKTDGGAWVEIGSSTWDVTAFTDGSTSAGHAYEYGVRSSGPGGTSPRVSAGTVYTTPTAPVISVKKTAAKTVEITMDAAPRWADGYEVQRKAGSSQWETVKAAQTGNTFSDAASPDGAVSYRVRARMTQAGAALWSGWGESEQIVTIAPPLAPSLARLDAVWPVGSIATVGWTPNHPDMSAQSAAQVEVTKAGSATVTDVEGAATSLGVKLDAAGAYRVRVRTKGLHASWGEWSGYADFKAAQPPSAHFTSPSSDGAVADALPVELAWEVSDPTGVSEQWLTVESAGALSKVRVDPAARVHALHNLGNEEEYKVTLELRAGSGLTAKAVRVFRTEWAGPSAPSLNVEYTDDLRAVVYVTPGVGGIGTERMDVYRVQGDDRVLLAERVLTGRPVVDPLPPLNADYRYVAVAYARSGASTETPVDARLDSDGREAFSFGPDAGESFALGYGADVSESAKLGGETFDFALGPDTPPLPSFYPDGTLTATRAASYEVTDLDLWNRLRSVARSSMGAECWYRDHWGGRARVRASWTFGYASAAYGRWTVSVSMEELEWGEPDGRV
jgi:hypothetical protein